MDTENKNKLKKKQSDKKSFTIKKIELFLISVPFKERFTHSTKSRKESENIILKIYSKDNVGYGEGVPREYVTGESANMCLKTLQLKILPHFKDIKIKSKKQILKLLWDYRQKLRTNELSAFCAFEIAILHLCAKEIDLTIKDIFKFLHAKPYKKKSIQYSGVIGDKPLPLMILKAYVIKKMGFKQVKIKVIHNSFNKLKWMRRILKTQELRIDANEGFTLKELKENLELLKKLKIRDIEQPFKKNCKTSTKLFKIAKKNNLNIISDEDICNFKDLEKLGKYSQTINLRTGKVGGIMSSIYMYDYAIKNNFDIIYGCLVGETVLSRINIILAQNFKTIANEGDYDKYLLQEPFLINPEFEKGGIYCKKEMKLSYKTKINSKFQNNIIKKITI